MNNYTELRSTINATCTYTHIHVHRGN